MKGRHRRVRHFARRFGAGTAIVCFLVTVIVTYPDGDGVVIPPASGSYDNFADPPAPYPFPTDR